ncbi:MAG TPA: hypothetical protein VMM18_17425 [Gemmatimonadaceae bacterium]|nr:hypothetical protein [Gemmatimonadaceae bacterium]
MSTHLDQAPGMANWTSAHSLARASWICPVLIIAINFALQPVRSDPASWALASRLFAVAGLALAIAGLGSGLAALSGVRRHGRRGILFPALAGSVVSSMYIAVFILAYL